MIETLGQKIRQWGNDERGEEKRKKMPKAGKEKRARNDRGKKESCKEHIKYLVVALAVWIRASLTRMLMCFQSCVHM